MQANSRLFPRTVIVLCSRRVVDGDTGVTLIVKGLAGDPVHGELLFPRVCPGEDKCRYRKLAHDERDDDEDASFPEPHIPGHTHYVTYAAFEAEPDKKRDGGPMVMTKRWFRVPDAWDVFSLDVDPLRAIQVEQFLISCVGARFNSTGMAYSHILPAVFSKNKAPVPAIVSKMGDEDWRAIHHCATKRRECIDRIHSRLADDKTPKDVFCAEYLALALQHGGLIPSVQSPSLFTPRSIEETLLSRYRATKLLALQVSHGTDPAALIKKHFR